MGRIPDAEGVGRTPLHRHFRNREALVRAIAVDAIEECEAAMEEARPGEGTVREAIGQLFETFVPVGERYHFLPLETQLEDPKLKAQEERVDAPIRQIIERGEADGTFTPGMPSA